LHKQTQAARRTAWKARERRQPHQDAPGPGFSGLSALQCTAQEQGSLRATTLSDRRRLGLASGRKCLPLRRSSQRPGKKNSFYFLSLLICPIFLKPYRVLGGSCRHRKLVFSSILAASRET